MTQLAEEVLPGSDQMINWSAISLRSAPTTFGIKAGAHSEVSRSPNVGGSGACSHGPGDIPVMSRDEHGLGNMHVHDLGSVAIGGRVRLKRPTSSTEISPMDEGVQSGVSIWTLNALVLPLGDAAGSNWASGAFRGAGIRRVGWKDATGSPPPGGKSPHRGLCPASLPLRAEGLCSRSRARRGTLRLIGYQRPM